MEQSWLPTMAPRSCSEVYLAFTPDEMERERARTIAQAACDDLEPWETLHDPARYHVSLLHVGQWFDDVPDEMIDRTRRAVATLAEAPFDLVFDRLQSFGRQGAVGPLVLCSGARIGALAAFRQRLGQAMLRERVGRRHGSRGIPHMTLSHRRRHLAARAVTPAFVLRARRLVLIESHFGESRHTVRDQWELSG